MGTSLAIIDATYGHLAPTQRSTSGSCLIDSTQSKRLQRKLCDLVPCDVRDLVAQRTHPIELRREVGALFVSSAADGV